MKKSVLEDVGPIYKFWFYVFDLLENILPFSLSRKFIFKKTRGFSDKWVMVHTIMSIVFAMILHKYSFKILSNIIVIYAFIRILEIVVYQINVLLFHPYKKIIVEGKPNYKLQSTYRSVVLLGHNFLEVIFWFTCVTEYFGENNTPLLLSIMDNTLRIFTFNYQFEGGNINNTVQIVFFIEVICGIILTIISLAKFIGELPHINIEVEEDDED